MLGRSWGLTTTYNHVHDAADRDPAVIAIRDLHADIDHAVLAAYGWSDLDRGIGHHPTKIGTRWTVSREAASSSSTASSPRTTAAPHFNRAERVNPRRRWGRESL